MVVTYASTASEFKNQANGPLVLTAYQLGYSVGGVALTVVRESNPVLPTTSVGCKNLRWMAGERRLVPGSLSRECGGSIADLQVCHSVVWSRRRYFWTQGTNFCRVLSVWSGKYYFVYLVLNFPQ